MIVIKLFQLFMLLKPTLCNLMSRWCAHGCQNNEKCPDNWQLLDENMCYILHSLIPFISLTTVFYPVFLNTISFIYTYIYICL